MSKRLLFVAKICSLIKKLKITSFFNLPKTLSIIDFYKKIKFKNQLILQKGILA